MLGWLNGLFNLFTGALSAIWNAVVNLVRTVYNWLDGAITTAWNDLTSLWNDVVNLADELRSFIVNSYNVFTQWVSHYFDDVISWAQNLINGVNKYISDVLSWANQEFNAVNNWVNGLFNSWYHWILSQVWDPLFNLASTAINWTEQQGAYVYDIITHPDKLVALVLAQVWSAWLSLTRQWAKPLMSFYLASWQLVAGELIPIIEDIISSVL